MPRYVSSFKAFWVNSNPLKVRRYWFEWFLYFLKRKDKDPQGENAVMVFINKKIIKIDSYANVHNCILLWQIKPHCMFLLQTKNEQEYAKVNNNYVFVIRKRAHSMSVYKWIMDSRTFKHMTLYNATLNT